MYLRKQANLTQREVAEALEVTEHTVRNWEKGREEPRLHIWQVKLLCRLFNCSLDDLPDFFKPENAVKAPQPHSVSTDVKEH